MTLHTASWRERPTGGIDRPVNRQRTVSPSVQACVPADLFNRLADEAVARRVPVSELVREALRIKYPEGRESP